MGCSATNKRSKVNPMQKANGKVQIKPSIFVIENTVRFQEIYKQGKVIGSGPHGEVRTCFLKENGARRAVKIMKKNLLKSAGAKGKVDNEKAILKSLDHPNIVRLYEFFEDSKRLYVVMEYCNGGELFSQLLNKVIYSEIQVAKIMNQIFSALSHMHSKNIIHRNLKPESIYLDSETLTVKLIGFTEACKLTDSFFKTEESIHYSAPEGINSDLADMWSCGIIMCILLSGFHPFACNNQEKTLENSKQHILLFDHENWAPISAYAKDLISRLVCDKSSRFSAELALAHKWSSFHNLLESPDTPSIAKALSNLRQFRITSLLQDAVTTFITTQRVSSKDTKLLSEVFKKIDKNSDGKLSREELIEEYKVLMDEEQAESEVDRIMKEVDTDNNGFIDYTEFLKAAMDIRKIMSVENLRSAFRNFDKDFSGKISVDELKRVVSEKNLIANQTWGQLLQDAGLKNDGEIDLHEFEELVLKKLS